MSHMRQWIRVVTEAQASGQTSLGVIVYLLVVHITSPPLVPVMPDKPAKTKHRDYYVVIHGQYKWDVTRHRPHDLQPEYFEIHAFDHLDAALIRYKTHEASHVQLELSDDDDLHNHNPADYWEEEARLWVIPATSKRDAYDKVFYNDTRRLLGYGGLEALLFVTDNEPRRRHYLNWWHLKKADSVTPRLGSAG